MREERIFGLIALLLSVLGFFSCAQQPESTTREYVGRFCLFQGYYEALEESNGTYEGYDVKAIFKIDTETGQVWKYGELIKTDTVIRAFTKVATDPQISFEDLRR